MFAVPGWNLTARLKTQTDAKTPSAQDASKSEPSSASKKRKRDGDKLKVNSANVADLWAKHIDGVKGPATNGKGNEGRKGEKGAKDKKKRKLDQDRSQRKQIDEEWEEPRAIIESPAAGKPSEAAQRSEKPGSKKGKAKADTSQPKNQAPRAERTGAQTSASSRPSSDKPTTSEKLTPLQASMRAKLSSARFRHLNETLYTSPSESALALFSTSPEMFEEYHAGFRQQVGVWPENPVVGYISDIKRRGKIGLKGNSHRAVDALPRTRGTSVVADFGCGDARLASELQAVTSKLHLKLHSFDLHSPHPLVTKADISSLPLPNASVDVGIFCLALMGTNWTDFIDEAFRVLRWKGELWVAEIKSRFGRVQRSKKVVDHSVGKRQKVNKVLSKEEKRRAQEQEEQEHNDELKVEVDGSEGKNETDVTAFVEVLKRHGFVLKDAGDVEMAKSTSVDLSNRMFVKMVFVKGVTPTKGKNVPVKDGEERGPPKKGKRFLEDESKVEIDEAGVLKPCVYKLR